jgi:hypothetical protein
MSTELANLNNTILTMRDVFVSVLDSIVDADAKLKRTNFANFESFATNNEVVVKEKLTGYVLKDYCQITTLDGKEKYIIYDSNRNVMVKDASNKLVVGKLVVGKYYETPEESVNYNTHNSLTSIPNTAWTGTLATEHKLRKTTTAYKEYTYQFNEIYSYNGKKNNTTNSEMLIVKLTKKYTRKITSIVYDLGDVKDDLKKFEPTSLNVEKTKTEYMITTTAVGTDVSIYLQVNADLTSSYKVTTENISFPTDLANITVDTTSYSTTLGKILVEKNPTDVDYTTFFTGTPIGESSPMKFLYDSLNDLEVTIKSTLKTAYYDDGTSEQKAIPLVAFMDTNNLIIDNASVNFDISIDYMSKTRSNILETSGVVDNSINAQGSSYIGVEGSYNGSSGYSYSGNWSSNNNNNTTANGNSNSRSGTTTTSNRTSGTSNYRSTNSSRGTSSYKSGYTANASYLGMYEANQVVAACNMSASTDTVSAVKEFKPKVKAVVNLRSVSNPGIQLLRENVISKIFSNKPTTTTK